MSVFDLGALSKGQLLQVYSLKFKAKPAEHPFLLY